jgi:RHH-type proline utilization regulon transcriptional repressor/proline dehydrogenase/delta 1-pyrroline-5-carboxylate dehydrogenase
VVAGVVATGAEAVVSVDPGHPGLPDRFGGRVESAVEAARRLGEEHTARVRVVGTPSGELLALPIGIHVEARPPVANGRVELLRSLREQAVSRTLHRFGNLVGTPTGRVSGRAANPGNAGNPPFSDRSR